MATTRKPKLAVLLVGGAVAMLGVGVDTFQQYDVGPKVTALQLDIANLSSTGELSRSLLVEGERNLTYAVIVNPQVPQISRVSMDFVARPKTLYDYGVGWMQFAVDDDYKLLNTTADSLESTAHGKASQLESKLPSDADCTYRATRDSGQMRRQWDCFNYEVGLRKTEDRRKIAADERSLASWSGVGRSLQVLGILIGLAKDLVE